MSGKAGLKAGLIGGAIIVVLTLLSQIPVLGCICCGLTWLAYLGIGALAGYFLVPPRDAGSAAGAGAIAGLVSGAVGGVVLIIVMVVQMLVAGTEDVLAFVDPTIIQQLSELGIDPDVFAALSGVGGVAIGGGMCCLLSLAIGAGLGAIGGAVFAAVQPE